MICKECKNLKSHRIGYVSSRFYCGLVSNRKMGVDPHMFKKPHPKCPLKNRPNYDKNKAVKKAVQEPIIKLNLESQNYRGLPLNLINRKDYESRQAKRYSINNTKQNIWIPNSYLEKDGTIKHGVDIMFVFKKAERQLELAGYKLKY